MATEEDFGELLPSELYWRDQFQWLLDQGYRLRSRYDPKWKPSWEESGISALDSEDALSPTRASINHAIRLKDEKHVVLKRLTRPDNAQELDLINSLSNEPLLSEPNNHCVPLLDTLTHPTDENTVFIIMPLLRPWDDPEFSTIGEALDFILQLFEAIQFLHERNIAYRDISLTNIMMDARELFTEQWHPCDIDMTYDFSRLFEAEFTRTEKPVKYYLIDFGISRRYEAGTARVQIGREGTDLTPPEFKDASKPYDPFPIDIYCLGNLLKKVFLEGSETLKLHAGYHGFGFLRPLVSSMVQEDPSKRPSINDAITQLQELVRKLPFWKLRGPYIMKEVTPDLEDSVFVKVLLGAVHWTQQCRHIVRRHQAIPSHGR